MNSKLPKVTKLKNGECYVTIYRNEKRVRVYSGEKFGISISPNSLPKNKRYKAAKELALRLSNQEDIEIKSQVSDMDYFKEALADKLNSNLSEKYKQTLSDLHLRLTQLSNSKIDHNHIKMILNRGYSDTSFNTNRRHLKVLIDSARRLGMKSNPMANIPPKKAKEVLHKPISDIQNFLTEIEAFNRNLHLCCLLTYGCLLRPHNEIRLLKWSDFSDDLKHIYLSGEKIKNKRNRRVPVPGYIHPYLKKGKLNHNIFSNSPSAFNQSYFKTLWRRFKQQLNGIDKNTTLYSFRHTGALELFTRTGSILKLKEAMDHSSIRVSLTYLRGLEFSELEEDDMPKLS